MNERFNRQQGNRQMPGRSGCLRYDTRALRAGTYWFAACLWANAVGAQPTQPDQPGAAEGAPATPANPIPGGGEGEGGPTYDGNLFGSLGGVRTRLGRYGVTFGVQETSEVFGNATGGINTGAAYNGATLLSLGIDTEKAGAWAGGTFNVSAWQIHGRNLNSDNTRDLQAPSGIEAVRSTRLWELWYQQNFAGGRADVKLGQQSIDTEFLTSLYQGLFINSAMGFPALPAVDLYAGGPAFPLSSLGVRVRAQLPGDFTVLAGVFDDNPSGGPFFDDSQVRGAEASGTRFSLNSGALFIAEVQYALNPPPPADSGGAAKASGLPGTYKLGGWFDTGTFPDPRFDTAGGLLADPASSGTPRFHRHNWSVYAVADQAVWRADPTGPRVLGAFARLMGAPGDRNLVDFSVNAGTTLRAPLPARADDTFGVGFGLARVGTRARQFDQDVAFFSGPYPVRSSETFVEVTYQCQATPWLAIQPDFQYFFLPSGGVPDPNNPGKRIGNEAVFGLRSNIVF